MIIRKAVLYGALDLRLEEQTLDLDQLGPHELFVTTRTTGFSTGTDLGNYEGRSTEVPDAAGYPRSVGYSNVGVVEAVGKDVMSFRPGDHVFSTRPHESGYIARDTDLLVHVPASVDVEQAALAYLVHLGVAALRAVHYEAGEDVAIVGLGVIGLCTIAVAKAMGARVVAIANGVRRTELARRLGAVEAYLSGAFAPSELFDHRGADIVVLTANSWSAYRESMEVARRGGRISVLGFPGRAQPAPEFNPVDMRWLYGKQLTIKGAGHLPAIDCNESDIRFTLRRNLKFVLNSMASGALDVSGAISHRLPYTSMKEAYELARTHSKDLTAAIFQWA